MTKLSRLLGNSHPLFKYNIEQLEKATGNAGVDTRLAIDILERAHNAMRLMHLDPADTTLLELQHALYSHKDDKMLDGCEFVIYEIEGQIISFNRDDINTNHRYQSTGSETVAQHATEKLKIELVKRYAQHERTHAATVYRLFNEIGIKSDNLEA